MPLAVSIIPSPIWASRVTVLSVQLVFLRDSMNPPMNVSA